VANKVEQNTQTMDVPLTVSRDELLVDGSDNAFRELVHDSLAFSVRLEAIREGFAKYIGLTGVQYTILISIAHLDSEGDVGVSDIAKHLSLSGTFVTTEVRKLVNAELLNKEPSKEDRRRVILKLTSKAKALLVKLGEIQSDINDIHFSPLSKQDFEHLSVLIKKLKHSTDRALVVLGHHVQLENT